MSGLLPNARRALLRPTNSRDDTRTASRIIGATLPVTIASTCSATAQSLSAPHVGFDCETLEQRNAKGVPRQEHTREATSYLFYISLDTPAGGVGWPLGRGWSQPERGGKRRSMGKSLPHAPLSHRWRFLLIKLYEYLIFFVRP